MKRSLIKLLLALLLVINPVAVLASDFHDLDIHIDQTNQEMPCHSHEQSDSNGELLQLDNSECQMPCCEDAECGDQGVCIIHYSSDVVTQRALRFSHPIGLRGWGASIAQVPDRELPPENPPPILI